MPLSEVKIRYHRADTYCRVCTGWTGRVDDRGYCPGCARLFPPTENEARRAPEAKGPAEGGGDAKRVHVRGNPTSTSSEASRSDERGHDETTTEE